MSFYPKPFESVRLEFHAAKLFSGQDIKGVGKGYRDLKQAYQITILANEQLFKDNEFYHSFEYYDPVHSISLNGRSRIITLELTKLKAVVEKPPIEMNLTERWAVYFQYLTDRSKRFIINRIVELEEGIAMASEVLVNVSRDEIEQARIQRAIKTEWDWVSYMNHAKEEGHAEGRVEGRVEGRAEGRVEGRAEGHAEERKQIISLIDQGLSIEEIRKRLEDK